MHFTDSLAEQCKPKIFIGSRQKSAFVYLIADGSRPKTHKPLISAFGIGWRL